jgi:acetoacetyl-CoA synthetase
MPSMPLFLWGDAGTASAARQLLRHVPRRLAPRRLDAHHADPHGGAIIYGRSDATINRHGIRMGTAELYRAVEALPEVLDSLVVDLEYLGRESWMPLFVVLREGLPARRALRPGASTASARAVGAPRAQRRLSRWRRCRARCPARRWSCR